MRQQNKFWVALVIITIVCFLDYQLFTEGYAVRNISPTIRQAGHFIILAGVIPIGYWAWKTHPMEWLKTLWMFVYGFALGFIIVIGALKMFTDILPDVFLDWATTVRMFFCSPLPHIMLYMLTLIATQKNNQ